MAIFQTRTDLISGGSYIYGASNWISAMIRVEIIYKLRLLNVALIIIAVLENVHLASRIMSCTPVQFILRLPVMSVFHQLQVDIIYLPSLVFSFMRISTP